MERIVTVNLPDIGEGVVEGEVVEWLKKVGDPLHQDEPVVVVMTDKATVELPAPEPGILKAVFWKVGEMAITGKPLYAIATKGQAEKVEAVEKQEATADPTIKKQKKCEKVLAAPATRHLAKMLGVSLEQIVPSGAQGEITVEDVRGAISLKGPKKILHREGDQVVPLRGIQWLMADTMIKSHAEVPQFTYVISYDPTPLKLVRDTKKGVTFTAFFMKAWALVAKEFPFLNASVDADKKEIYVHRSVDLGIAVDTVDGLLLPVIKGVDKLSFSELVKQFDILKEGAKTGTLSPESMRGGTLSISNFGTLGGVLGTPLIPYGQTAILGIGKMEEVPVVKDGKIEIGLKQYLSLSCDHRIIDGGMAARAAEKLVALLMSPAQWS